MLNRRQWLLATGIGTGVMLAQPLVTISREMNKMSVGSTVTYISHVSRHSRKIEQIWKNPGRLLYCIGDKCVITKIIHTPAEYIASVPKHLKHQIPDTSEFPMFKIGQHAYAPSSCFI
jgi:hypothetical protein